MIEAEAFTSDADWRWSSTGISAAQALTRAEELCSREIARSCIDDRTGDYSIHWQHYWMGAVKLNFLQVSPQQVRRTQSMTHLDRNDGCDLLLMRSGAALMKHGKSSCDLTTGAMILLDCTQSWDLTFPEGSHCLTAHMDGAWLRRWLPDPSANAGRRIDASHPWAAPLAAMFSAISVDGLQRAPLPRALIADQMGSLLALAAGQTAMAHSRHSSELARRIRQAIRDRFNLHDLSADSLAQDLGISRRYLDKVLSRTGVTFVGLLEEHRLSAARLRLQDPCWSQDTVATIAWSCGYTDPGYFARRFRRQFGSSPSAFRRRATEEP